MAMAMRWALMALLLAPAVASAAGMRMSASDASWSWESDEPWAHLAESLNQAGDVNCDGFDDFILGSYYWADDNINVDTGRAWLFYGSATGPDANPDVTFVSPTGDSQGWFAQEAKGVGDVNGDNCDDLLISMVNYDEALGDEGGIFIYHGSPMPGGIDPNHDWHARGGAGAAHFGWGAGGAGDVNGDGYADVIGGAVQYGGDCPIQKAYLWHGSATGLGDPGTPANADWSASDASACSWFGLHVGTAGDVNGDGYDDIFVAAPLYDNGQVNEGKVFVWHGSDTGLGPAGTPANADWSAESNQLEAALGNNSNTQGVSSAGDVNGDGFDDLLISSYLFDTPTQNAGMAAVWMGSDTGLTVGDPDWVMTGENQDDVLGYNVASAGDFNGDGFDDVVLAAHGYDHPDDPGNLNHGRAFIWLGSENGLLEFTLYEHGDCLIDGEVPSAALGVSAAGIGDIDDDGLDDIALAAWYYANPEEREGIVYAFMGEPLSHVDDFESADTLRWTVTVD